MPDRILKQEKDDIPPSPTEDLPEAWERPDVYLPVATETSPLPPESRVIVYSDPRSPGADRFRWAGMRLKSLQAARGLKTLLITSPLPGDGKSTVALNLATVLADKGKHPVLLVEADTYRPSILNKLGLRPWPGLFGCYQRKSEPRLAIRRIRPTGILFVASRASRGGWEFSSPIGLCPATDQRSCFELL